MHVLVVLVKGSLVVIDTDAYKVKMSISPGGQAAVDLFTLKGLDLVHENFLPVRQ